MFKTFTLREWIILIYFEHPFFLQNVHHSLKIGKDFTIND